LTLTLAGGFATNVVVVDTTIAAFEDS